MTAFWTPCTICLAGISGSTILLIMGVYLPAIQAVSSLLPPDLSVLPGLCASGLGVLLLLGPEALRRWTEQRAASTRPCQRETTA